MVTGDGCVCVVLVCVCAVYAVYAVYAISSPDTSVPLRCRTQHHASNCAKTAESEIYAKEVGAAHPAAAALHAHSDRRLHACAHPERRLASAGRARAAVGAGERSVSLAGARCRRSCETREKIIPALS